MPRLAIPTNLGQHTNTDEWAGDKPAQIVNLLLDEHGTLTSRPGLLSWATPNMDAGIGSAEHFIGLAPMGDRLIGVCANRRVVSIGSTGDPVLDITDDYLAGNEIPTFLEDDSGRLLIFGGGQPLCVDSNLRARRFAQGLASNPTHGGIVDRKLIVNDINSDYVRFSDVGNQGNHDNFVAPSNGEGAPGAFRAGTRSDIINALVAHQNRLFLFGEKSVEAFYGTGSSTLLFSLEDDPIDSECSAGRSVIAADGTLWWVDGRRRFVKMQGRQAQTVSLPVERQIQAFAGFDDCITHLVEYQGRHLILLHSYKAGLTLAYDYALNTWSEWRMYSSVSDTGWKPMPLQAYAFHPGWNRHFCAGFGSDAIFELSPTTYQDNSTPLVKLWRGPFVDGGDMSLKNARKMSFLLDGGTATSYTATAETYNPEIEVRWRNESREWQDYQPLSTGRIGRFDTVRDVWCRTNFRRLQTEWRCSAAVPIRVTGIEMELTGRMR